MADRYENVLAESTFDAEAKEWTHNCGSILLAVVVHHSLWDRRFACGGYGEVQRVTVPYCPTCEEKPSEYGEPIFYAS